MKLSVEQLKKAWQQVASVCPSRTPREIYQYVRLDINGDAFALHATDGELYVIVGNCEAPEFSRLLPVKAFTRLLAACTGEQIGFAENVIKCAEDVWELSSPDVEDWPFSGIGDTGRAYRVDCDQLHSAAGVSLLSVDVDSTRYALGGVLFDFINSDTLALVATDGRRLSISEVDCECEGDPDSEVLPVVPLKTIKTLIGLCGTEGEMSFAFGATGGIVFSTSNATINSPLVQGNFPAWRKVVPDSSNSEFDIVSGALGAVLKSASITTSEESQGLDITLSDDGITATSQAADIGRSRVNRRLLFESHAEMRINPDYLLPVLQKLGDDCQLTLNYTDSESALLFSHDGGFRYVLMPLADA